MRRAAPAEPALVRSGEVITYHGHTNNHGSHTWAVLWKEELERLLRETER